MKHKSNRIGFRNTGMDLLAFSLLIHRSISNKQDRHQSILRNQNHEINGNLKEDAPGAIVTNNICLVCKKKAGKHLYYGAKSCQSCRAFYRRSVMRIRR